MGIFNFLRGKKHSKLENLGNENIENNQETDFNAKNTFLKQKNIDIPDENKKIVFTEEEVQKYIQLEIRKRTLTGTEHESHLFNTDPLFIEAARIIIEHQQGSSSLLQRKLKLGYNRANKLIDRLEIAEIISPFKGSIERTVLIPNTNQLERFLKQERLNNKKIDYFKKNILPLHEELISSKVLKILKEQEIAKENKLKESLKQEILIKEQKKEEEEKIRNLKNKIRKELIEEGILSNHKESDLKRELIPQDILDKVWNRDGGKCVKCGSQEKIEFDHIIPFSKGGSNTYRNLQVLCEKCNRTKSNNIG